MEKTVENEDLLEFYQYRLFKKLNMMQYTERYAYMTDLFGRRWTEVYSCLASIYPQLLQLPVHSKDPSHQK